MSKRRALIAAVAVLLGVIAGGAAYAYLNSVQQRAYHDAKLVDVFEVTSPIIKGLSGTQAISQGSIKKEKIPQKFRPIDAVTDLATIESGVATADLPTGQVLVAGLFATPAQAASSPSGLIPKGDVAVTVSVDSVHDVAGLPQPGDLVDILVEQTVGSTTTEHFLGQGVKVLAVGTSFGASATVTSSANSAATTATTAAPTQTGLVTFAVTPVDAARIAYAESGGGDVTGSLYLALLPPGATTVANPTIGQGDLLIPVGATP